MSDGWSDGWHSKELQPTKNITTGENVSVFQDNGTLYVRGDDPDEWMYCEKDSALLENRC